MPQWLKAPFSQKSYGAQSDAMPLWTRTCGDHIRSSNLRPHAASPLLNSSNVLLRTGSGVPATNRYRRPSGNVMARALAASHAAMASKNFWTTAMTSRSSVEAGCAYAGDTRAPPTRRTRPAIAENLRLMLRVIVRGNDDEGDGSVWNCRPGRR